MEAIIKDANRIAAETATLKGRPVTNREYTQILREVSILHEDRAKRGAFSGGPGSASIYNSAWQCSPRCEGTKANPCMIAVNESKGGAR